MIRTFRWALVGTAVALVLAFLYGGLQAVVVTAILGILEVSLSFDNAVVNATILQGMSANWQKVFLTIGVLIAVVGMRLLIPLLVVGVSAKLSPIGAIRLAAEKGDPATPGTYGYILHAAHAGIAGFGGAFLLLIAADFFFEDREVTWLTWLEKPLARIGHLDQLSVVITLGLLIIASRVADNSAVLFAGVIGVIAYLVIHSFGELVTQDEEVAVTGAVGKSAFFLFCYLELLDATFSFDGVIGAVAITSDPILIALGLGIGAIYVRSLTVHLVREGTLSEYRFLEHGAFWAIGALALILLVTIRVDVPEIVTGLIGVSFIAAAFLSSTMRHTE